jgi:nucleoside-diphosphate-sugar epimerase
MTILVVGATGATGRLLVTQLLDRGQSVRVIVRSPESLPDSIRLHERLTMIRASILDLSDEEIAKYTKGCTAVASCLGHSLNLKGIFGHPRRLVTEATVRLCEAIKSSKSDTATRFVLMNTAGNSNRDLQEPISLTQNWVIGLLRLFLPPHVDNEKAADFLRASIGQNDKMLEWVVVRPDTLINQDEVTEYVIHPSPTRSAILNAGTTSRVNVAHFMTDLIMVSNTWNQWKGKMPVIYNKGRS